MRIVIVVAVADNGVIGKDNALLWRLPKDLQFFKSITMGKPIVMGRKTYESIGKPLPGRTNIVITRSNAQIPGVVTANSLQAALEAAGDASEVCVIGGGEIYRQALPMADVVYLTEVHATVAGDVYFPKLDPNEWRETRREEHSADERHQHAFSFVTLEKGG